MYVSSLFGFDRGFDFFEDFDLLSEKKNLSGTVDAENIIDTALSWFGKQSADKPLFFPEGHMLPQSDLKSENPS